MSTTKNHLGNIQVNYTLAKGSLFILDEHHYYPFGLEHGAYNPTRKEFRKAEDGGNNDIVVITGVENSGYQYKYNGKELQDELGLDVYDYQWRAYDPTIGRFNKIDRFAEKYKNSSPYTFTLNNPVKYREIAGDSINLMQVLKYDKKNRTSYAYTITESLQKITGLQLSLDEDTGMLTYDKDENGKAMVTGSISSDGKVNKDSSTAANDLISAIDNKKTGYARISNRSKAIRGGLLINMGPTQIDKFMNGSRNVNKETLGYGMTFLHEMLHSALGLGIGDDKSYFGATGGVVDRMNVVRKELGASYGQRESYMDKKFSVGGKAYIPFDSGSLNNLNTGTTPTINNQKYIEY